MRKLRLDLERVRLIIDVIRHRESAKQKQQEQIQLVLSRIFFPHEPALRFTFEKILRFGCYTYTRCSQCTNRLISYDRQGYFKSPVNKHEVPDYYDIVKEPMCWDTIDQRLDSHEYLDLAQFKVRQPSAMILCTYPHLSIARCCTGSGQRNGLQPNQYPLLQDSFTNSG